MRMDVSDLPWVVRRLQRHYEQHRAPIVDLIAAKGRDPFQVLVATILSARTRDDMTAEVCGRLFPRVGNLDALKRIPRSALEKLIFPIGFYKTKAKHLKALPAVVERECGGSIPDTIEALCRLPGVGRKTANLVVVQAFDKPGICVDVHVHRISNRFGLIRTRTPLETEMTLRSVLPRRYWKTWNSHLVAFGQTVCRPIRPHCSACALRRRCARAGVTRSL
jgi:endonuclease III